MQTSTARLETGAHPPGHQSAGPSTWRAVLIALGAYTAIAIVATWPLLPLSASHIASGPGDPILNTSILVWNATTVPFSAAWWNAPHFYPSPGVIAFTENLLGVYPFAAPVYWLTSNPLLTYNLTLFVTWPLAGVSVYLLVRLLTRRDDAAFLAGLAFAFTPYRAVALGHLQTLTTFGIPLAFAGLHGYLRSGERRWLVLFGVAWLHQGLANGYYILYGGLAIGLWLLYFCSAPENWRRVPAIAAAGAIASLPLVPILFVYRRVHEEMGLHRSLNEILYFSAHPASWFEAGSLLTLWGSILPEDKDNLFHGLTVPLVILAALAVAVVGQRRNRGSGDSARRVTASIGSVVLWALVAVSSAAIVAALRYGSIDTMIGPIPLKVRDLDRALVVLALAGAALVARTPAARRTLVARHPLVFYSGGILVFALLACGPVLRVGDDAIWSPAPYGWLMLLPGFNELRVPTQLKMIHLLCLCVTAGFAVAWLGRRGLAANRVLVVVIAIGILGDGWLREVPMTPAQSLWPDAERADRPEPILELPLGPDNDFGATLRAAVHHRRVMNGVSGYEPPHYVALKAGLAAHDPAVLRAIASLGPIDIVVDRTVDPAGANDRYAAAAPGATLVVDDGARRVYRVPEAPAEAKMGEALPIVGVTAVRHDADWPLMHDGRDETGWGDYPQRPDSWVTADIGTVETVGGVTTSIGDFLLDFPRRLRVELSTDGNTWETAWEGPTFAQTFLGFVRQPRNAALHFPFPGRPARFVRLKQLEAYPSMWRVSEIRIHRPASSTAVSFRYGSVCC